MNPIQFECPHCGEINTGDESLYGRQVTCQKCQTTIFVPRPALEPAPQTARLIPAPGVDRTSRATPATSDESDVFQLTPALRAFSGHLLLALIFLALAVGFALRRQDYPWADGAALGSLALGLITLFSLWGRVKSCDYRLTTQRLFVRRGWLSRRVEELELYRVKDVVVDQGVMARLLGYGTITVLADDDTTPSLQLERIAGPIKVKEVIRTQYRAARQREGVRPTEFMRSP